ncbi:MAG: ribosomal protein [Actinomycetota bacterium]
MKTEGHPKYTELVARCSCGNVINTKSTRGGELVIDLCNECHPYFTGKQKLVDTGGRVDRFNKRYGSRTKKQG